MYDTGAHRQRMHDLEIECTKDSESLEKRGEEVEKGRNQTKLVSRNTLNYVKSVHGLTYNYSL